MANLHRGEVEFTVGEDTHKLSFSANAMVEISDALGRDFGEVIEDMKAGTVKLSDLRVMFWQGLRDNKSNLTLDDAKVILSMMKPADMGELVAAALVASMPKGVADQGNGSPPQAKENPGIGTTS